jgi:hypothetical protein
MRIDFHRRVENEVKQLAETQRYYIMNVIRRALTMREFVEDIVRAIDASPLRDRKDFAPDSNGDVPLGWYTYNHDGCHIEYVLKRDESISVVAPIIKWMTTNGWVFRAYPEPEHQRVVYHFTRGNNQEGNLLVGLGDSESCKLVETGEEEIIPSRTVKKHKIVCEGSVDEPMQMLEQLPVPDGDEEQARNDNSPF